MLKVKRFNHLDEGRKQEVRELEERCQRVDHTNSIAELDGEDNRFYLGYHKGVLQSFIGVYLVDEIEKIAEVSAFVDPIARKKGYFIKSLKRAEKDLKHIGIKTIEFVYDPVNIQTLKVFDRIHASYVRSEYIYTYDIATEAKWINREELRLEEANIDDLKTICPIYTELFGGSEEYVYVRLQEMIVAEDVLFYKLLMKDDRIIGFAGVVGYGDDYCIFDVGINKEHQSKGYGTVLMGLLVTNLSSKNDTYKKVILHTNSQNQAACHMYERFGCEISEWYDYYKKKI